MFRTEEGTCQARHGLNIGKTRDAEIFSASPRVFSDVAGVKAQHRRSARVTAGSKASSSRAGLVPVAAPLRRMANHWCRWQHLFAGWRSCWCRCTNPSARYLARGRGRQSGNFTAAAPIAAEKAVLRPEQGWWPEPRLDFRRKKGLCRWQPPLPRTIKRLCRWQVG